MTDKQWQILVTVEKGTSPVDVTANKLKFKKGRIIFSRDAVNERFARSVYDFVIDDVYSIEIKDAS